MSLSRGSETRDSPSDNNRVPHQSRVGQPPQAPAQADPSRSEPEASSPQIQDAILRGLMRDLREAQTPAFYGSVIAKLSRKHRRAVLDDDENGDEPEDLGITGDDHLVIQTTESNTPISYLDRMMKRLAPPGLDLSADPETIPPELKAQCAPHMFRRSKGGFSDVYLSDEFCRYLAGTHSDPNAVPNLAEYTGVYIAHPLPDTVAFETCANCAGNFLYSLGPNTEPVRIIKGVPLPGTSFQAISYVWGETVTCNIPCRSCAHVTNVPLRESSATLHSILNQAGPGKTVWLDCVSINQSSPADIAAILPQMGIIYGNAERVCVILPASDTSIFDLMGMAFCAAWTILCSKEQFAHNRDARMASNHKEQKLSEWVAEFIELVEVLDQSLNQSVYFQRAWTFQEWALAREIDVAHIDPMGLTKILNLKSVVIDAACLWARYIMMANQHAEIDCGRRRDEAPSFVAKVRKLFPHEEFWLAEDEIDGDEAAFQIGAANTSGVEHALGIRSKNQDETPSASLSQDPDSQDLERKKQTRRITTMLTAFNASARQARYPADLVASWASMSNISYPYDKNDTVQEALLKVVPVLRDGIGIKIFNFFVTNDSKPLTVDGAFIQMAAQQHQSNINAGGTSLPLPSAPAFTGRVDTGRHIAQSLRTPYEVFLPSAEEDATIRRVKGAKVVAVAPLDDMWDHQLAAIWTRLTYGLGSDPTNDFIFHPPARWIPGMFRTLGGASPKEQVRRAIAIVSIKVTIPNPEDGTMPDKKVKLWTWIICPYPLAIMGGPPLVVARESVNGTLMLFQEISVGKSLMIRNPVGYLTLSDNRAGTFLLQTSASGTVEIRFPGASIPGLVSTEYSADRLLRCTVKLSEDEESVCIPEALR